MVQTMDNLTGGVELLLVILVLLLVMGTFALMLRWALEAEPPRSREARADGQRVTSPDPAIAEWMARWDLGPDDMRKMAAEITEAADFADAVSSLEPDLRIGLGPAWAELAAIMRALRSDEP